MFRLLVKTLNQNENFPKNFLTHCINQQFANYTNSTADRAFPLFDQENLFIKCIDYNDNVEDEDETETVREQLKLNFVHLQDFIATF